MSERSRFELHSGERQTGAELGKIRKDHVFRYECALECIQRYMGQEIEAGGLFGLDIFCATGYGTYLLGRSLPCVMWGIEGSEEAVRVSRQAYPNQNLLFSCKIYPFVLPQERFDFIVCIESLEHVDEYSSYFKMLSAALVPKGTLILTVPNEELLPLRIHKGKFHVKHFYRKEIEEIAHSENFMVKAYFGQNLYLLNEEAIVGNLSEEEMQLVENQDGQIMQFAMQKKS